MTDTPVFQARRQRLMRTLGQGVAVLATAPEQIRNRDSHFPFRFDSHFYYLSGPTRRTCRCIWGRWARASRR